MDRSSLSQLLQGFSRQGRDLLRRYAPFALGPSPSPSSPIDAMCGLASDLVSSRGEASGVAIASDLLGIYLRCSPEERIAFFEALAERFNPDPVKVDVAWGQYKQRGPAALPALAQAVEAPRQELFRRLNAAPGGTAALVRMREHLLAVRGSPAAVVVDADLSHLLQSWFNRGFLSMLPISWSSPADLLERVIRYEAVHDIGNWDELRSRLDPPDRRCFGFFHPAMPEEPLIFVEVALTRGIPNSIQAVLAPDRDALPAERADTAVFYSISNSQPGLRGISFGHFLIKQVATDLKRDLPNLNCFVTLSPIPGFLTWVRSDAPELAQQAAEDPGSVHDDLLERAVHYFLHAKNRDGRPIDPVARFHLGNGARLERLNWMGDNSAKGLRQSGGLMVNYLYDLASIEERHEAYANQGLITFGRPIGQMLSTRKGHVRKQMERQR